MSWRRPLPYAGITRTVRHPWSWPRRRPTACTTSGLRWDTWSVCLAMRGIVHVCGLGTLPSSVYRPSQVEVLNYWCASLKPCMRPVDGLPVRATQLCPCPASQELLSGPSLLYEYDSAALDRFLSYLQPPTATVYLADSSFAGTTTHVEQWWVANCSILHTGITTLFRC